MVSKFEDAKVTGFLIDPNIIELNQPLLAPLYILNFIITEIIHAVYSRLHKLHSPVPDGALYVSSSPSA